MRPVSSIIYDCWEKTIAIAFIFFFFNAIAIAQEETPEQKISSTLLHKIQKMPAGGKIKIRITIKGEETPADVRALAFQKIRSFGSISFFESMVSREDLISRIILLPEVIFVEDGNRIPNEEVRVSNLDLSLNKINKVHRQFPLLNGDGLTVSVKENKPDTADIDFKGRFLSTHLSSSIVSSHATNMATLIAGAGNTWHLGKGAAWGSRISSSDFASLLPDASAAYQQYSISVQNHSYGVGIENYYGADASAYDITTINDSTLLHIFSAGNMGTSASNSGTYSGIPGFANLTGSFKMAKNVFTVGATDSFNVIASLSSKGPAFDGRIKPDLVAFGEEGSSGAAALVSGVALMLQQQYKLIHGKLPASALLRAVLINSATDVGNEGIDFSSGFGSLNALNAVKTIQSGRFFSGDIQNQAEKIFSISIPPGLKKIKLILTWNDLPATANASKALLNDLDLELINSASQEVWKPWVLSHFPHIDSLKLLPIRKRDSLNNVEQITTNDPVAGVYQLKVIGRKLVNASQSFYIAYLFDSVDLFEWDFPVKNNFLFSSAVNTLRWSSSFNSGTGILEYSINNGISWQQINNAVDISAGFYKWQTPSVFSEVIFRMSTGSQQFLSDTVTLAERTFTGVGFNCPDSFLLFWKKLPGINSYRVLRLGDKYLEPMFTTTDSFLVFAKNTNTSLHYAIAPIIGNHDAVKSYTFNYTTLGVECYIRSFLVSLQNNSAQLLLSLGTLYNMNRIVLEKYDGKDFKPIQQFTAISNLQVNFTDVFLIKGLNSYRIKLELSGGRNIYSAIETVYYFSGSDYIIYPNPVQQYQSITILADDPFPTVTLQVMNGQGQKLFTQLIEDVVTTFPTGKLSKGIYYFRFIKKEVKDQILKVIVQ
ncbi:MAG TPA: S8 family serine peptidase [Chitinophagaceae bacterium]|nr:S8 family serine peptidase [Chitinophagaceae bacterium]